jgi:hypothetical protein
MKSSKTLEQYKRREKKRMKRDRCDICHKIPRCPDSSHHELKNMFFYTKDGVELSGWAVKRLGADYLEKLRNGNRNN